MFSERKSSKLKHTTAIDDFFNATVLRHVNLARVSFLGSCSLMSDPQAHLTAGRMYVKITVAVESYLRI